VQSVCSDLVAPQRLLYKSRAAYNYYIRHENAISCCPSFVLRAWHVRCAAAGIAAIIAACAAAAVAAAASASDAAAAAAAAAVAEEEGAPPPAPPTAAAAAAARGGGGALPSAAVRSAQADGSSGGKSRAQSGAWQGPAIRRSRIFTSAGH